MEQCPLGADTRLKKPAWLLEGAALCIFKAHIFGSLKARLVYPLSQSPLDSTTLQSLDSSFSRVIRDPFQLD